MLTNSFLLNGFFDGDIMEGLGFTTENLYTTLKWTAIGMAGIFTALLVIYLFILILQKAFPNRVAKKK